MKMNRSIRFDENQLKLADKLEIDVNEIARAALSAEISRRLTPEYKKQAAKLNKELDKILSDGLKNK